MINLTADDLLAMRPGEMNTGLGGLASNLVRERERKKEERRRDREGREKEERGERGRERPKKGL